MHLLEIKGLKKSYDMGKDKSFLVLKNINLTFEKGEIVSIVGESGSGKSTLMHVIGGLDLSYEGDILYEGSSIKNFSQKEIDGYRKNNIGFIFQSFHLIPHLTVLDNVAIAMTLSDVKQEERVARAQEILKEVGLENHRNKRPNQLSGGQKQRVAIARALMNNPDIILADEPTGALDANTTNQVLELIVSIAKKGKLVIMVTHSDRVAHRGSRIVRVDDGKIVEEVQLKEKESFVQAPRLEKATKQNLPFFAAVKLAFYNMKQKIGRNILVALGSSIGVMSIILMLAVGSGVKSYMEGQMSANVNPFVVEVSKHSANQEESAHPVPPFAQEQQTFEEKDIQTLSKIDHVKSTHLGWNEMMNPVTKLYFGEKQTGMDLFGTLSPNVLDAHVVLGKKPTRGEIIVDKNVLKALNLSEEQAIGAEIQLSMVPGKKEVKKSFVISGLYQVEMMGMPPTLSMGYIPYEDLADFFQEGGQPLHPTTLFLETDDRGKTQGISKVVQELGYAQSIAEQMVTMFNEMLDVMTLMLTCIAGISLVVSAIMILVVLYISVVERTSEIGVMKAIGARVKDIRRIFVSEAFLIGIFTGLFAMGEGILISLAVNYVSTTYFQAKLMIISGDHLLFALGVSVLISMIAGILPANQAARLDPIESLRHE